MSNLRLLSPSRLGANNVARVENSEWDLGQVPNESPTMRQYAVMHWASKLAHSKGDPLLLALIVSDTGRTDVGRKWQELKGLIRSLQCTRRTRNLAESFRPNLAAQGNALLNLNKVACQILDLLVRYLTPYRRGWGTRYFLVGPLYDIFLVRDLQRVMVSRKAMLLEMILGHG